MTFAGLRQPARSPPARERPTCADGQREARPRSAPGVAQGQLHGHASSGVFTDETGRENRATGTFTLDPKRSTRRAVSDAEGTVRDRREDPRRARALRPRRRTRSPVDHAHRRASSKRARRRRGSRRSPTPTASSCRTTPGSRRSARDQPEEARPARVEERAGVRPGEAEDRLRGAGGEQHWRRRT